MKIALITDGIYPYVIGGMQKHSLLLAKYLSKKKIFVDLYHYIPEDSIELESPFSEEENKYIKIISLDYPETFNFPGHYLYERYLYSNKAFVKFQEQPKPDFIYIKGFAGWKFLIEKKQVAIPMGVNFHGYEMFQQWPDIRTGLKLQLLKSPVKYHLKKADFLFSYGGGVSSIIEKLGYQNKIIEIPSGISKETLKSQIKPCSNKNTLELVFVGRAERRKGIQEINECLQYLHNSNDIKFHFIGPVPENLKLNQSNTIYHGLVQDQDQLFSLLDKMDILVCPSHSEGMPNVILEGMTRGLAIMATRVGAIEAMVDNQNGWLLDPENLQKDLIKNIKNLENLPREIIDLKKEKSLKKISKYFTWERVIEKTIENIETCINS